MFSCSRTYVFEIRCGRCMVFIQLDTTVRIKYSFLNSGYIIHRNIAAVHMFQKNDVVTTQSFVIGRGGEVAQYSQVKLGF